MSEPKRRRRQVVDDSLRSIQMEPRSRQRPGSKPPMRPRRKAPIIGTKDIVIGVVVALFLIACAGFFGGLITFAFAVLLKVYYQKQRRNLTSSMRVVLIALMVFLWMIAFVLAIGLQGASKHKDDASPTAEATPKIESPAVINNSEATPNATAISTPAPTAEPTPSPEPTAEPTPEPTETPEPTATPLPTLKQGMTGDDVEKMQRALIYNGYLEGLPDGNFGPGTASAVKAFQKKNGLSADGVAGEKTLALLYSGDAVKQIWVWIPTKGGTKYHTDSSCSDMDNPKRVLLEDAKAKGYDSCARCAGGL